MVINETGWRLRDQLINTGLLRPGIDCATVGWEEPLEVPPQRFPVAGYVFKINPNPVDRLEEVYRREGYVT